MATNKRVFTLRMEDEIFDKIGKLATAEHRSMTNYIEYILLDHIRTIEQQHGPIEIDCSFDSLKYSNTVL